MRSLGEALGLTVPEDRPAESSISTELLSGQAFSEALLESREYRESLRRRILTDTLPPAVECKLIDHGWGKVAERLDVTTTDFAAMSSEELESRALFLAGLARTLREHHPPSESSPVDTSEFLSIPRDATKH